MQGTKVNSEIQTRSLDDIIHCYAVSNQAENKSPATVTWYNDMLRSFSDYMKRTQDSCRLNDFTVDIVRGYIIFLRQKPKYQGHPCTPEQTMLLSPKTLQGHVRALKAFSSWLFADGYTKENVLSNLKLPKAPVKLMEPLTPDEISQVIRSIDRNTLTGARNYTMLVTLLDTGLRASELANITLGNLDLTEGFIKVMGKGSKERIVPIGKFVRMTLWNYIERIRPRYSGSDNNYLFLTPGGKPILVNTVKLLFSRLAKVSGVTRLHAHLCRHTFAINYLMNGGDIFSLREILGHTTLEMVNHYLRFTSSQITEQHHKYSPMDKLQRERNTAEDNSINR